MTKTKTFETFTDSLSTEIGIDKEAAQKVVTWLINEGVLDVPVINDTYAETQAEEKPGFMTTAEGIRD